jgi:hypothetical protein
MKMLDKPNHNMIEYSQQGKGDPNMDRTETTVADWITQAAFTEEQATAKFKWWCINHGSRRAYANVSIREQALIPAKVRVALIEQFAHVNAPEPTTADINQIAAKWCDANAYREVTTRELGDALGVSQAVARRVIRDLPHYFKRVNQYKHEVRNYRGEREIDKTR